MAAILASELSPKEKVAILEEGATNEDYLHRYHALEALAEIDAAVYRRHLIQTLKSIPANLSYRPDTNNPAFWIVGWLRTTDDRDGWQVLADLTRRASPNTRHHFITSVGWPLEPDKPDPGRRECLRYLLGFLDDSEIGDRASRGPPAIRDHATVALAVLLGSITREEQESLRSPREISILRERVREWAEHELARPQKK